jgi:two-component system, chemotaxis family, protein-glutamate methylesterase/glutaminase
MLSQHRNPERFPGLPFDIVAIGTSTGGLQALSQLLGALPLDFPVPIVVVQYLEPSHPSLLATILLSRTRLMVKQAEHDERLRPRCVYIAPPNRHLLVHADHTLGLSDAAKVQYSRPSVNVLFEAVAQHYQAGAIVVVLSGALEDGAAGVRLIKEQGGRVLIQDRTTAVAGGMPSAALATGKIDFVLPIDKIASALVSFVMVPGAAALFTTAWRPGHPALAALLQ